MQRTVSSRALRRESQRSGSSPANAKEKNVPEVNANGLGHATEKNSLGVEDAEAANGRDVLDEDVLCVGAWVEKTAIHESSQSADEQASLIRLVEANLERGRSVSSCSRRPMRSGP